MAWLKKLFGSDYGEEGQRSQLIAPQEGLSAEESQALLETEEGGELAVDVYQDKDNVYIKSTIAGVSPEDLDISIGSDAVTIRGERHQEEEIKEADYMVQECYWGAFSRAVALPEEVDVDKAEADLKDGILTLTLPKASRAKTKKLKVKSGM